MLRKEESQQYEALKNRKIVRIKKDFTHHCTFGQPQLCCVYLIVR